MPEKSGESVVSEADPLKDMHAREVRRNFVLKAVCLVVLTIVTTVTVVLLRFSRNVPPEDRYISSTAIVISEIVKVVACLAGLFHSTDFSFTRTWTVLNAEVIMNWKETSKLFFPSVLYIIQNNLLFLALSHLNAATYQVTYQLKILTTAVFSYYMLNKQLHRMQWFSLVVLMVGVALVQLDPDSISSEAKHPGSSTIVGLICVILASLSSGLAGVYFEKLIKTSVGKQASTGLTIRNLQMGVASIFFGAVACVYNDYEGISSRGFLAGYNLLTWVVIMLQAFGGLIVAVTIKYADNILKGFATSFSIILSSASSYFFLGDLTLTVLFVTGTVLVIAATFLYGVKSGVAIPPVPRVDTPKAKKLSGIERKLCQTPRANSGVLRRMTSLIARLAFYPSVGWTMIMEKLSSRRWYDRIDDTVIVGAIPTVSMIPDLVEKEGIRGVVSMNEDFELKLFAKEMDWARAGVKFIQLPIVDMFGVPSKSQLERGLAFIADIEQTKGSVYVHCKAGRVRSATLVGYYLMSKYDLSPADAASTIRRKRSQILITPNSLSSFRPETASASSSTTSASSSSTS